MTVEQFLRETTAKFDAAGITSARLDAQVLLCRVLNQNKAWLLAHGKETIDAQKLSELLEQVRRRAARQPLAYIVGFQEFYGRRFKVNPDVLIPRPETEQIIEDLRALPLPDNAAVLDVGTGSGAIAITAALELPHLRVQACDISPSALALAEENAQRLGVPELPFFVSNLLTEAHQTYDAILANLPYVARDWQRSPETNFEPQLALFAEDDGLEFIKQLLEQAPAKLNKKGYLLLEADPRQHNAVADYAQKHGLKLVSKNDFIVVLKRV
jgi:release factor glutamine methyltransferase